MKFDRKSPADWVRAGWLACLSCVCGLLAAAIGPARPARVVLSGHALNGNLAQLARARASSPGDDEWCYLAMSAATVPRECPLPVLRMWRAMDCLRMARASVIVTDHGPGILTILSRLRPRVAFVDVWHGVGFKALGASYGAKMSRYRAVIAASRWDRDNQVDSCGIRPDVARDLGYCLIEPLLEGRSRGADPTQILIAPTWSHGATTQDAGLMDADVLGSVSRWAETRGWAVVLRAHLNTSQIVPGLAHIRSRPMSEAPDTVAEMLASSILITDWSSIATDFHVLERPVVYWDRPSPFDSYRLDPSDRVGPVVDTPAAIIDALELASDRARYDGVYGERRRGLLEKAHGAGLDGGASERVLAAVRSVVTS